MKVYYKLDEKVSCPSCGNTLDNYLVAKDFVLCGYNGKPMGSSRRDYCDNCGKSYLAMPVKNNTMISFTGDNTPRHI